MPKKTPEKKPALQEALADMGIPGGVLGTNPFALTTREQLRLAKADLQVEEERLKSFDAQMKAVREAVAKVEALESQDLRERTQTLVNAFAGRSNNTLLNALVPAHTRTSCHDGAPGNPDVCPRCYLLRAIQGDITPNVKWAFTVE